ncbi:MAG: D-alanyl-D-alanine carboxypeptidase family protein [Rhodovibrionaceae bacterium]|nr:D-alanyl-D-alanine carboxypeptidase family protein [Rhodovibrionaceae bacterium]
MLRGIIRRVGALISGCEHEAGGIGEDAAASFEGTGKGGAHRTRKARGRIFGAFAVVAFLISVAALPQSAEARYASIVIDAETGTVLHEKNADTRNYPASLTKMMTLYMTFEALEQGRLSLGTQLPVSARAAGMTPSKLGLKRGTTIKVEHAILALVTKSANDAAVVLAEALGGTEFKFGLKMTERARELGMSRTTFRNASGLPNRRQLSTARDMATLSLALIRDFPQYYEFFKRTSFSYGGRTYENHNNLLDDYSGTDGIKTGYIRASGFNLAASVKRNGRRLIAVVFGGRTAKSRDRHIKSLLDRGFIRVASLAPAAQPPLPERKPAAIVALAALDTLNGGATATAQQTAGQPVKLNINLNESYQVASLQTETPVPPARPAGMDIPPSEDWADGAWGVQVGAYRQHAPAERMALSAASEVPHLLGHTRVLVSKVAGQRGPIFRARLVGLSESHAREACRLLEAQGRDCLAMRIGKPVELAMN